MTHHLFLTTPLQLSKFLRRWEEKKNWISFEFLQFLSFFSPFVLVLFIGLFNFRFFTSVDFQIWFNGTRVIIRFRFFSIFLCFLLASESEMNCQPATRRREFSILLTLGLNVVLFVTQQLLFFFSNRQVERIFVVVVADLDVVVSFDFFFGNFRLRLFFICLILRETFENVQSLLPQSSFTSFSISPMRSTSSKQSLSMSSLIISSSSSMLLLLLLLLLPESASLTVGSSAATGCSSCSTAFSGSFVAFEGVVGLPGLPLPRFISNRYSSGSWPSSRSAYTRQNIQILTIYSILRWKINMANSITRKFDFQ